MSEYLIMIKGKEDSSIKMHRGRQRNEDIRAKMQ
jgi:hypothetical protein